MVLPIFLWIKKKRARTHFNVWRPTTKKLDIYADTKSPVTLKIPTEKKSQRTKHKNKKTITNRYAFYWSPEPLKFAHDEAGQDSDFIVYDNCKPLYRLILAAAHRFTLPNSIAFLLKCWIAYHSIGLDWVRFSSNLLMFCFEEVLHWIT